MRPKLLAETLKAVYNTPSKRSVCVEGPPGGGKTSIIQQVAQDLGIAYVEKHLPTMLVEDFGILFPEAVGKPTAKTSGTSVLSYRLPEWFPDAANPSTPPYGILCFDDRNQASADLQKVLANIIQARSLHGHMLPPGWMVVSTGNRQSDRAGANRVLSHLRNRETVVELDTHVLDWTAYALEHGVHPVVVSFVQFRTALLHEFDPNREANPTPRSWVEGISPVIGVLPPEAEYEVFKGAIGEGAAAEFTGYLRIYRNLPDPQAILLNPETAAVPSDPATLYALAGSLADYATQANFDRVCSYLARLPGEFSILCVTLAVRHKPDLTQTGAFRKWSIANQALLF